MYKQNVKVENNEVELRPTETTTYWDMDNTNDVSSSSGGSINTTGHHFSSAEAGYNGISDTGRISFPVELGGITSERLLNN